MDCIRLTRFLALPVVVSLMLGALATDVQADICKEKRFGEDCVNSADVDDKRLGSVFVKRSGKMKSIDVKDEAGLNFSSGPGLGNQRVVLKQPRKGWAVATASADIRRDSAAAPGVVRCNLTAKRAGGAVFASHAFIESVNSAKGVDFTSVSSTLGFQVTKGKASVIVNLSCTQLSGSVKVGGVRLIVQYFPTRY